MFNLPYDFSFPSRFKIKKIEENFTLAASSRTGIFFFLFTDVQGLTKAFSALVVDILNRNIPLESGYKRCVRVRDPNLRLERNSKRQ